MYLNNHILESEIHDKFGRKTRTEISLENPWIIGRLWPWLSPMPVDLICKFPGTIRTLWKQSCCSIDGYVLYLTVCFHEFLKSSKLIHDFLILKTFPYHSSLHILNFDTLLKSFLIVTAFPYSSSYVIPTHYIKVCSSINAQPEPVITTVTIARRCGW